MVYLGGEGTLSFISSREQSISSIEPIFLIMTKAIFDSIFLHYKQLLVLHVNNLLLSIYFFQSFQTIQIFYSIPIFISFKQALMTELGQNLYGFSYEIFQRTIRRHNRRIVLFHLFELPFSWVPRYPIILLCHIIQNRRIPI